MNKLTLTGFYTLAKEEKKSRFTAVAAPVLSIEEVSAFFEREHDPAATHNAWAYKVGNQCRFSDDGEVSGTAGKPIFGALEKQGLDNVAVMVRRYYGGIKLGTGGLVRAYGGVAARCLQSAPKCEIRVMKQAEIRIPFKDMGKIRVLLTKMGSEKLSETMETNGVFMKIRYDAFLEPRLLAGLQEILRAVPDFKIEKK